MLENLHAWFSAHFYWLLIAAGVVVFIGALRNWEWVVRIQSASTLAGLRGFVEGLYGVKGRLKFERFLMGAVGFLFILCGLAYAYFTNSTVN